MVTAVKTSNLIFLYQAAEAYKCISCEVRTSFTYKKVTLSNRSWKPIDVSCEVRTSFTYKKVTLSLYQTVEAYRCVSCEVLT
jgi:hypothetical protein